ncbi:MAG: exodeoxyribonuclease V subunit alpha [Chlorobium sp.]|nr:exodeoxyribonuclease V subunit alpha [Chlorobium phaeovibrioides]NQU46574.1 exodeoxyribonuclease V subunit alpha [Chlorobium sp.]
MTLIYEERAVDSYFSRFVLRLTGAEDSDFSPLRLAVSMAARRAASGDVCFDLASIQAHTVELEGRQVAMPSMQTLRSLLFDSGGAVAPGAAAPLVLDEKGRLYLYRYWKLEHDLAKRLLAMAAYQRQEEPGSDALPSISGMRGLESGGMQEKAVIKALSGRLTIIAGGPGTGKTAIVARILSLLRQHEEGRKKRIALGAPTGKAAARLHSSLKAMSEECGAISTIHRLLGTIQGSSRFRHNPQNPLPFDLLVIDEASMIALPLMAALVSAMRPEASLILLGDPHQLASVESGAVLGDICSAAAAEPQSPIGESLVTLNKSYRFTSESALGRLSMAVNAGDGAAASALFFDPGVSDISFGPAERESVFREELKERITEGFRPYLEAETTAESLRLFDRFRILAALREGPGVTGVKTLNRLVEEILQEAGLINPVEVFYHGRPVMLSANDSSLNLFNGDTGIVVDDALHPGQMQVAFMTADGSLRSIAPERLPSHETAYAMTIHKSQGSEFDHVLMILPEAESPLLTRELLYTGITRARQKLDARGGVAAFEEGVKRTTARLSGLADALRGAAEPAPPLYPE